jgi:hypothetical protein
MAMMSADLHLGNNGMNIDIRQLKSELCAPFERILIRDNMGNQVTLYPTVEQIEEIGKACLDYVHAYNAAAMVETVKRMEGQVA